MGIPELAAAVQAARVGLAEVEAQIAALRAEQARRKLAFADLSGQLMQAMGLGERSRMPGRRRIEVRLELIQEVLRAGPLGIIELIAKIGAERGTLHYTLNKLRRSGLLELLPDNTYQLITCEGPPDEPVAAPPDSSPGSRAVPPVAEPVLAGAPVSASSGQSTAGRNGDVPRVVRARSGAMENVPASSGPFTRAEKLDLVHEIRCDTLVARVLRRLASKPQALAELAFGLHADEAAVSVALAQARAAGLRIDQNKSGYYVLAERVPGISAA